MINQSAGKQASKVNNGNNTAHKNNRPTIRDVVDPTVLESIQTLATKDCPLPKSYQDCINTINVKYKLDERADWEIESANWIAEKTNQYIEKDDLNKIEAKEKLKNILSRLYKDILVRGKINYENGGLMKQADKDTEMCLFLLNMIKWNGKKPIEEKLSFVNNDEKHSGYAHIGSGKANGVNLEKGHTLSIDGGPSSFHILYTLLKQLGCIRGNQIKQFNKIADFMNVVKSYGHQATSLVYPNHTHDTLLGTYRSLSAESIFYIFKNNPNIDPTKGGSINTKRVNERIINQRKSYTEKAVSRFETLKDNEQLVATPFGEFIFDIGDNLYNGSEVATYKEVGHLKVFQNGSIQVFHPHGIPKNLSPLGEKIFETKVQYISPNEIIEAFNISNKKVINKLQEFYKDIEPKNLDQQEPVITKHKLNKD